MSALEREALRYARAGLRVLPVKGKLPAVAKGVHAATDQETRVGFMFRNVSCDGVGIACGHPLRSGGYLAVLDIDPKNDGDATIAGLEAEHGEVPPTWTVRTPSGGWHYYLSTSEPHPTRTGFRPGLDLRGVDAYVVAPPSPGYVLEATGRVAPAPEWVLAAARHGASEKGPAPALPDVIPEGRREWALTSLAGTLRRRGLVAEEILACIGVVNESRCRPKLGERDMVRIARSVERYTPKAPLAEAIP